MRQLSPCGSCGRHVDATELACPFCRSVRAKVVPALVLAAASLIALPAVAQTDGDAGAFSDAGDEAAQNGERQRDIEQRYDVPVYGAPAEPRSCHCNSVGHDDGSPIALATIGLAAALVTRRRTRRR